MSFGNLKTSLVPNGTALRLIVVRKRCALQLSSFGCLSHYTPLFMYQPLVMFRIYLLHLGPLARQSVVMVERQNRVMAVVWMQQSVWILSMPLMSCDRCQLISDKPIWQKVRKRLSNEYLKCLLSIFKLCIPFHSRRAAAGLRSDLYVVMLLFHPTSLHCHQATYSDFHLQSKIVLIRSFID